MEFYGVSHHLSTEAKAWHAAGIDLPGALADAINEAYALQEQHDRLVPPARVTAAALHAAGTPPREAVIAEREYDLDLAAHDLEREAIQRRAMGAARKANLTVVELRPELIKAANAVATDLVTEMRSIIAKGVPDGERILLEGKEADLKRLRALRAIEVRWVRIQAAWHESLRARSREANNPIELRDVNPAFRWFARPDLVKRDVLAGRTFPLHGGPPLAPKVTILDVAREDEACGFRLATYRDIVEVHGTLAARARGRRVQVPLIGVGLHPAIDPNTEADLLSVGVES